MTPQTSRFAIEEELTRSVSQRLVSVDYSVGNSGPMISPSTGE